MSVPAPIKRSKELAPLSREHHEGLLFVFKIRQGLKHSIEKERMAAYCIWSWQSHFDLHFKKEEKELVPVLGAGHPLIIKMLAEHKVIAGKFAHIKHDPAGTELEGLAQLINDHIRFEEKQLFPLIEQTATPDRMRAIEQSLAEEKPMCNPWPDAFWIRPK